MEDQLESVLAPYRSPEAALRYEGVHRGRRRDGREARCLLSALSGLPESARVLDLPCGTGRMFAVLTSAGFEVVGADGSESMVARAREAARDEPGVVEVRLENVSSTSFPDAAFDAVVCNRLLHHFALPGDRRAALSELARISSGPVVFSFFCSHSVDALKTRVKRTFRRTGSNRAPVSYACMRRDVVAAGLRVERIIPTLPGVSQQWYVVAVPRD